MALSKVPLLATGGPETIRSGTLSRLLPVALLLIAACQARDPAEPMPGVVMEPIGTDASGCALFQPNAGSGSAVQTIFYRRAGGGFTMRREEADCAAPAGGQD